MADICIEALHAPAFHSHSLDDFVRHQVVTECWRQVDGQWQLLPIAFTEDWGAEKLQQVAGEIAARLDRDLIGFGAWDSSRLAGFATVGTARMGSRQQYVQLEDFQVSKPYRGLKIGKKLFSEICDAARKTGAEKLCISAHSSKESQAAYRALGCRHAEEIIARLAEEEPCDVQLEYVL